MKMQEQIPLSKRARAELWGRKWSFSNTPSSLCESIFWGTIMSLCGIGVGIVIFMIIPQLIFKSIWALCCIAVFFVSWKSIIHGYRRDKRMILEYNQHDYLISLKINDLLNRAIVPGQENSNTTESLAIQTLEDLTPVRVDYFSQTTLHGEMAGTLQGLGFLVWTGRFSGSFQGEATPNLQDQSSTIVCTTPGGGSIRLICQSVDSLKQLLLSHFERINGHQTHSAEASTRVLEQIMNSMNVQQACNQIIVQIELPREQREQITVSGIPVKEGMFLVTSIAHGALQEIVIPVILLQELQHILQESSPDALPPIPIG